MVICLERSADLHMAQLMPLPLTVSCSSKILDKGPLNECVCVFLFYFRAAVSAFLYARLSCLRCQALADYLMFFPDRLNDDDVL